MAQNIIVAPQIETSPTIESDFHDACPDVSNFYAWLTTPSVERQQWLKTRTREVTFDGPFCITQYS